MSSRRSATPRSSRPRQRRAATPHAELFGAGVAFGFRPEPTGPPPPELPPDIEAWLTEFGRTASATEDYPESSRQRLVYVLRPIAEGLRQPALGLQVISAKLTRDGGWAAGARPFAGANPPDLRKMPAEHLRPSDRRILRGLAHLRHDAAEKVSVLADEAGAEVLARALDTGRARWRDIGGPVLRPGPPRPGRIAWQAVDETRLAPRLEADGDGIALASAPPVYVDPDAGLVGPLETGHPASVAGALLRAPSVPAVAAAALHRRISARLPALASLAPPIPATEHLADIEPVRGAAAEDGAPARSPTG